MLYSMELCHSVCRDSRARLRTLSRRKAPTECIVTVGLPPVESAALQLQVHWKGTSIVKLESVESGGNMVDKSNWPAGVHSITIAAVERLGIDDHGKLYWDAERLR
jgi:hypothetical protein